MTFIRLLYVVVIMTFSSQAFALSDEALFLHARDAYIKKNALVLSEDANQLKTQQYLLAPYADYWLILLNMEDASDEEVQNFLVQYNEMPFVDRVRGEWLKKLGKQENWKLFFDEYARFQREDTGVQCYALLGHQQLKDSTIVAKAKTIWMSTTELPPQCNQLFDALQMTGELSTEDIWAKFRLALQESKLSLAKNIATRLSNIEPSAYKLLDRAYQSPQSVLDSRTASFKSRFGAELNLFALDRLARNNIDNAINTLKRVQNLFDVDNRNFAWGRIAYHAARAHHPEALTAYRLAVDANLDKEQLAWNARSALRSGDWRAVLSAISAMPAKQAEESAWRYWKARALKATAGTDRALEMEANAIFRKLSVERHYYGWLAAEELDSVMSGPAIDYKANDAEIAAIASQLGIKRALELQRLDLRAEAKAEWTWATRGLDDRQLLAAADYAMRKQWYDVAINTADNTKLTHNFNLRYPTPYREMIKPSAMDVDVDEAWVYGIVRQESRFMHYARSGVGAAGLMQLMPSTAKWTAKRKGMSDYDNSMIHDLSTNIELGTYYLRYTLDLLGGQEVLATAGYNAGPNRAKRWMAVKPLEAAIYIETIPFSETRSYVQKVMANTQIYAPKLASENKSIKVISLKERLGTIPANGKASVTDEDSE